MAIPGQRVAPMGQAPDGTARLLAVDDDGKLVVAVSAFTSGGDDTPTEDPGVPWAQYIRSDGAVFVWVPELAAWVRSGGGATIAPSDLVAHRVGLTAVDNPNYPSIWVSNTGVYNNAKVAVFGATWAPTDTAIVLTFRLWRRSLGDAPERSGSFSVTALTKFTATLSDEGTVTYAVDSVVDDDQDDFDLVRPVSAEDPSTYIFTAEPDTTAHVAVFGWPGFGGIPPALLIQESHFPGAGAGWVGGFTPDNTTPGDDQILTYSVRRANITFSPDTFPRLGGADFAVTLETKAGTGQFVADVGVVLF